MTLSPAFLDELRTRTLLSALIARTVKLSRAGREWKANCPFHNEKSPSFYVNDDKGFYHCFGCSQHGDAISWLTEKRGLPFMDAVKELADAAGMEVPAGDPRAAERTKAAETLFDVMQAAAEWYAEQLHGNEGAAARGYLDQRGIIEKTRRTFLLGLAPDGRSKLRTALSRFGDSKLIEAGLLGRPDDGREPYDRFRGRLMIPIRDRRGRIIAFGGRILGAGEPKYLNSPETPLFDKGRTLFNLDRAASASRDKKRLVVVEGNFDVISLDQAGLQEVVAPLGTAVTEEQLQLIWRLVDVPTLAFDGDAAGRNAAVRVARRALPVLVPGRSLNIVTLPKGEDPDSLLRQGGRDTLENHISKAAPLSHFLYSSQIEVGSTTDPEGRAKLRADLDAIADLCTSFVIKTEYRKYFRETFNDEFGWTPAQKKNIAGAILKTGPGGDVRLLQLYVRSALYGLSMFPLVASQALEPLGSVRIDHPVIGQWRDNLMDAVEAKPRLALNAVQEVLQDDQEAPIFSAAQRRDLTIDLRFSFLQASSNPSLAQEKLLGLVLFLSDEQELKMRMQRVDRESASDPLLDRYDEIEARRQILREQRAALNARAYQLGTSDTESGVG